MRAGWVDLRCLVGLWYLEFGFALASWVAVGLFWVIDLVWVWLTFRWWLRVSVP